MTKTDNKEALEALKFVCRTIGWLEVVPHYGDAVNRTKEADKALKCCETIRAALTSQAPEGWQLVPKEPDRKMIYAAIEEGHPNDIEGTFESADEVSIYKAMLAAAPVYGKDGG